MSRRFHGPAGSWPLVLLACLGVPLSPGAWAQTNRLRGAIDSARMVPLRGSVHASALPQNEIGLADPGRTLNHISINFKPAPDQQAELDRLLADQQDPASPGFHAWLTPEQFGDRFGLSAADLAAVVEWLRDAGFQVTGAAAARNWVAFDGSVATVQRAFHTEIHNYRVGGERHFANSSEPSLPAAIAPLVTAINGLNDFHLTPAIRRVQSQGRASPDYTNGANHVLVPDDYAVIYDIRPLYNQGYDGTGQKLVILGESDITLSDITSFRSTTGLPAIKLQQILVPGVTDPGHVTDPEGEADLDLEWSGAVARNAAIIYVYSPNVSDAMQYALSPPAGTALPGPVVSMSFGGCEAKNGQSLPWLQSLVNQGNAQGVTLIASSGDSGAAGCDVQGKSPLAEGGLGVEVPAAVPNVTALGGTQFNEGAGNYWSTTNSSTGASAQSYIPEVAWNESGTSGLAASGGGISTYYPKPAWQTGFAGVPAGNFRAVPDVAMAAAAGHDGYLWVSSSDPTMPLCKVASNYCSIGGTSAAAPSFAGIITILNQFAAANGSPLSNGGQGNLNPTLYRLFTTTSSTASKAFHDITSGNNVVQCQGGTPDCTSGSYGYNAGTGYDPVTGLGSVDANNLVVQWYGKSVAASTTSVTASPTTFTVSSSTTLAVTVTGAGGTPSGSVSFQIPGKTLGTVTLTVGAASLSVSGSQFATGSNTVTAVYSGDSNFSGSSSTVTVTVSLPTGASAVVPKVSPNPVPETPSASGIQWPFTVTLTETAGTATTLTGFSVGGVDYSSLIVTFFGTANIAAKGAISASLAAKGYTPPTTLAFVFSGADASGQKWTQTTSVTLLGPQTNAAISLVSAPTTVYQNPARSNCQWFQNLEVQELNGFGVVLNRFLAASYDLSSQIGAYFGNTQLSPFGSLQAGICWSGIVPPETLNYELDGVDGNGNAIKSSAAVTFQGAPATTSALSLSTSSQAFQLGSASGSASALIAVTVPAGIAWSVSVFPANQTTSWLTVVPSAGSGPGVVSVTASGGGLSNSVFKATLTFQAPQAVPSFINVPVTLTIGSHPVVISAGGVVPVDSAASTIQPGSWVSIYGSNLASGTAVWNGDFPTTLGGVSVTIDGKPAYLWYVSPGQINLQAPADTATGPVSVLVQNSNGSATSTVTLSQQGPAFLLLGDGRHAAGIIYDLKGGGTQGGGTYDFLGPASAGAGFRPAKAGELVSLYGIGFGPTNPPVAPGQPYNCPATGCATMVTSPKITVEGITVPLAFAGVVSAGLYQFNFYLPTNAGSGDQMVQATVNGVQTPTNVYVPIQ
ncbi:MAG TPA: protease pro-enzyme activation domain-containing protein [Bryobacteraceae bacterium]|nr:protease pro-enzyme activation domain-containing protein [Bryobacteraceae bacterium]